MRRHRLIGDQPVRAKLMGSRFVKRSLSKAQRPHTFVACAARIFTACASPKMFGYAAGQKMSEDEVVKRGPEEKAAQFAKAGKLYQKV